MDHPVTNFLFFLTMVNQANKVKKMMNRINTPKQVPAPN